MKRRSRRSILGSDNPVSLFPFLAVLICTMGVLILLLVILVRQARLKAVAQARAARVGSVAEEALPSAEKLRQWEEDLQWQEEQLRASRDQTQQQLTEARTLLGHVEDSLRRLRDEGILWQEKLRQLEALQQTAGMERKSLIESQEAELAELQRKIADLKRKIEEAKRQPSARSYAIIPYQGPHGTRRRPIYLECRSDGVYLQPEGIRFPPEDFLGALGPGNPLDAALRAVREEWLARREFDPDKDGEPYPLLIVRPSGIEAYYAARAAMMSWGTEFGYELVEDDWTLSYPPPDPRLAQVVQDAVALARRRQEFLVQSAPGKYGSRPRRFRPAPYVGGAVEDISEEDASSNAANDPMLARWQQKTRWGGANNREISGPGSGMRGSAEENQAQPPSGGVPTSAEFVVTDQPVPSQGSRGSAASHPIPGIARPHDSNPARGGGGDNQVTPSSADGSASRGEAGTAYPESLRPLADRHGEGWALLPHDRGMIPVTRPIKIECFPDRFVLVPDNPLMAARVFLLDQGPETAVEDMVKAIREYITSWGMAGRGMYWRPILRVHVVPGAEKQFDMLQRLLAGSGLLIEKVPEVK
ncbi:MAG: hypothetical protein H5U08_03075 [Thermogutta sp.]|uniref:hypothetical protein n=1 Tax=Thermogutta sp. TaxID=1962930 RepID=UPI00199A2E8D|nr:hypothetical protein [Thermogutta sp.]MBC7351316.1 hypothetical protein [Thermogutta sp.]